MISIFLLLALSPAAKAARPVSCPDCSLIVIGMDDVRADSLGFMGSKEAKTPNLDRWAERSVVFTQAISQAPWTLPSFMSLFTSMHPTHHRMLNKYVDFSAEPLVLSRLKDLNPRVRTLAELLQGQGWRTAAFTGGAGLNGASGFSSGFEVYYDSTTFGGFDKTVPMALSWLDTLKKGERFFLFVHGYEAHRFHPGQLNSDDEKWFRQLRSDRLDGRSLSLTPEERTKLVETYRGAVTNLDSHLAPLLRRLAGGEWNRRVVVAIMADHGEELLDHGGVDHGMTLYEELIHVPMLLYVPGLSARRLDFQARLIDLMPTALDVLNVPVELTLSAQMEGISLRPALEGGPAKIDALSETDFLLHASLRALRSWDGWKLIFDNQSGQSRLYHVPSDLHETRDRSEDEPKRAAEMERRLRAEFAAAPADPEAKAVVAGHWKLVSESGRYRLFDLARDPAQRSDLYKEEPVKARELTAEFIRRGLAAKESGKAHAPSPELLRKLKEAGYW